MKVIEVVAAIIKKDDEVFVSKRNYGDFKDKWEFPGGKIEDGETKEEALHREIYEELEIKITDLQFLTTVEYDYENFHLTMHCYLCEPLSDEIKLSVHDEAKYIKVNEMHDLDWVPADISVVNELIKYLNTDEPLFKNSCIFTLEILTYLYKKVRKKSTTISLIFFSVMFFITSIIVIVSQIDNPRFLTPPIMGFLLSAVTFYCAFFAPKKSAEKIYKNNMELYNREVENKLEFYENNMVFKNVQSKAELNLKYDYVSEIIDTDKLFILKHNASCFLVDKNRFSHGNVNEFGKFLNNKCKKAKRYKRG